ncbi:MAG: 4,5-dihydroxyphthalate decarboxylase [Proteobacteria bacterium]|nr:4,5-dihydroxyphthalate decarboxylase [Pseudomonadota bacterium]MDA1022695.1 4,5-dihydroxyphthalate decarboxylase [Pseudomonadota bacterium]
MADHVLKLACCEYDRTRALLDGRVGIDGWQVETTSRPTAELFPLAVGTAPYDITEMSLSSYLMQVSRGQGAYVAVPIFVSRAFRHGDIYVRTASGIREPKNLEGCLLGVPEYQMTLALWVRGILQDEYGVDIRSIHYRTGGVNITGRKERLPLDLPEDLDVKPIAEGETLNDWLAAGKLDAVMAPEPPACFTSDGIRRLFEDPQSVERDYFARTSLFPIMHVIGIRKSLLTEHPGLDRAVVDAFGEAMALSGAEPVRPDGVAENCRELEAMIRYAHEQNLTARKLGIEELFAPETLK